MQQWHELFAGDVQGEEEFYAMKREERREDQCCRWEFAEQELENPNSTIDFDLEGPMWDDL
jgi:hypothetical protein